MSIMRTTSGSNCITLPHQERTPGLKCNVLYLIYIGYYVYSTIIRYARTPLRGTTASPSKSTIPKVYPLRIRMAHGQHYVSTWTPVRNATLVVHSDSVNVVGLEGMIAFVESLLGEHLRSALLYKLLPPKKFLINSKRSLSV